MNEKDSMLHNPHKTKKEGSSRKVRKISNPTDQGTQEVIPEKVLKAEDIGLSSKAVKEPIKEPTDSIEPVAGGESVIPPQDPPKNTGGLPEKPEKPKDDDPDLDFEEIEQFVNRGDVTKVELETGGRFDAPPVLYFNDYTTRHVNDLAVTRPEDLIETIIAILSECVVEDFKCEDLLMEEFLEVMIGMKLQFNTKNHTHRFECDCQNELPKKDRKLSEYVIDISTLKYKSIEDSENDVRKWLKTNLDSMSEEQFLLYKQHKYRNEDISIPNVTRGEIVAEFSIKDTATVVGANGDVYSYRFPRIGDLVRGIKLAHQKINPLIRKEKAKTLHGVKKEEMEGIKRDALDKLNREKNKLTLMYSRAISLKTFNDMEPSIEQKLKIYSDMPRKVMTSLAAYFNRINFGLFDERDITCNLCGNTDGRLLQRETNGVEFLPIEDNSTTDSQRQQGELTTAFVFM